MHSLLSQLSLSPSQKPRVKILASRVYDSPTSHILVNQVITISRISSLILDIRPIAKADGGSGTPIEDPDTDILDIRGEGITLCPGFIDTNIQLFPQPSAETSQGGRTGKESSSERLIRATVHARNTLMSGYTTVRDLGTEGPDDAMVALRACISAPINLVPGPRLFTAGRVIVSSGNGGDDKTGVEIADGELECVKAVRRQAASGADWIKIQADRVIDSSDIQSPHLKHRVTAAFTRGELSTLITTAHSLNMKIAAFATQSSTVSKLLDLGIDSIEHGHNMDVSTLTLLLDANSYGRRGPTWNPMLSTHESSDASTKVFKDALKVNESARNGKIRVGCGGGAPISAYKSNTKEMAAMVGLGADWRDVLRQSTLGGWECVRPTTWERAERLQAFSAAASASYVAPTEDEQGIWKGMDEWPLMDNDVPLGAIRPGYAADMVAFKGDLLIGGKEAFMEIFGGEMSRVDFVVKSGKVYKARGIELPQAI